MHGDHFMMGKGRYNGKDVNMFWDSGLVVVGVVDGKPAQAWLNVNKEAMERLGIEEELNPTEVTATADTLEFAGMVNNNALICGKPGKAYDWGGIRSDLLVGYGIQKKYAWTIDFDNMTYMFKEAALTNAAKSEETSSETISIDTPEPYIGSYEVAKGVVIKITEQKVTLLLQAPGQAAVPMEAYNDGTFGIPLAGAKIEFEGDPSTSITGLLLTQGESKTHAVKK